jgi:Leucine-rich repeat (LRR) protein
MTILTPRDISGNALTSLTDRFDTLPTLANINAASNNLTGPIPTTLLTHPTLKTLNLASNGYTGEVVFNSVNLTSIALNKNQLSSVRVVEGSGLVKVDLADNKFQGLLPDLTSSPYLQIFDASNNK